MPAVRRPSTATIPFTKPAWGSISAVMPPACRMPMSCLRHSSRVPQARHRSTLGVNRGSAAYPITLFVLKARHARERSRGAEQGTLVWSSEAGEDDARGI